MQRIQIITKLTHISDKPGPGSKGIPSMGKGCGVAIITVVNKGGGVKLQLKNTQQKVLPNVWTASGFQVQVLCNIYDCCIVNCSNGNTAVD